MSRSRRVCYYFTLASRVPNECVVGLSLGKDVM